ELERLLVRLARFLQLSLVLVADGEIVVRGSVRGIDLRCFFPAVDRFAPETALRDVDAERHLRFRVAFRVGERRRSRQSRRTRDQRNNPGFHRWFTATIPYLPAELSKRCATAGHENSRSFLHEC